MKNDLPPACDFQISLTINCESTWPGLMYTLQWFISSNHESLGYSYNKKPGMHCTNSLVTEYRRVDVKLNFLLKEAMHSIAIPTCSYTLFYPYNQKQDL